MSLMPSQLPMPVGNSTSPRVSYVVHRGTGGREPRALNKNFDTPLWEVTDQISELLRWPEGWNGYDVAAPNHRAVNHAYSWIRSMYEDALAAREDWRKPHVTADEDGDVMFEWWNGEKHLTVYVSEQEASYVTDWGLDITNEMDDGDASTPENRRRLWMWLTD